MHWKLKALLEEQASVIEILNTILEEISFEDLDKASIGELQAFIDLSHEVRNFCYSRRGVV
jgi:hypothetical protein